MYTVITADDEPMIKRTLKKLLGQHGQFEVVAEAEDGREALAWIERLSPDVVITDIRMPVLDGLELLEALQEKGLKPEVVIISGYDDFAYAQKAIRFGAAEYLLKPIRPAVLQETLDRLAARIDRERQEESESGKWVVLISRSADEIADRLWLLDEPGTTEALQRFDATLASGETVESRRRTAYVELLRLVDENLRAKGALLFDTSADAAPLPRGEGGECLELAAARLASAMAELRKTRNWGSHQAIQRAVEYVKERFALPTLTMQEAAAHIQLSPAYFSRSFKEEVGVSFVQYVTRLRIDKAKQLLEDPGVRTVDIPEQIGYVDYPHFAKVFKKATGVTPTEYRRRLGVV